MICNILSIAGSDPSGGAGIQADIKTISANGGYAMAVITALTAQNTQHVSRVAILDPDLVAAQIAAIRDDIRIDAVKIGMLGTRQIMSSVVQGLHGLDVPVVLDPVMVAKSGDRLLQAEAVDALRGMLHAASIVTPNLPEAADLLGCAEATSRAEMETQAQSLMALGARAVMLKGGHLVSSDCPDLVMDAGGHIWLPGHRCKTQKTHGTGCTLSSALATLLGKGLPLFQAAQDAKAYVANAIAAADALSVGQGHGPTHHFHAFFKGHTA